MTDGTDTNGWGGTDTDGWGGSDTDDQTPPNPSEYLFPFYLLNDDDGRGSVSVGLPFSLSPQQVVSPNASPILYGGEKFFIVGQTDTQVYIGTATLTGTGKVIGFVFEDATTQQYFLFSTTPLVLWGTPITIHVSSGAGDTNPYNWDLSNGGAVAYCFMAGTEIATPTGGVAVEMLRAGDLVLCHDGRVAPVSWVGVQTIASRFADRLRVLPVRITAGALGNGLPWRDLLLSPDHALLLDGVLVQAGALVNGASIRRETNLPERFCYYHVELADHALLLAEGLPAESFLDQVSVFAFDNWHERPALAQAREMALPRVKSARQLPRALRARSAA